MICVQIFQGSISFLQMCYALNSEMNARCVFICITIGWLDALILVALGFTEIMVRQLKTIWHIENHSFKLKCWPSGPDTLWYPFYGDKAQSNAHAIRICKISFNLYEKVLFRRMWHWTHKIVDQSADMKLNERISRSRINTLNGFLLISMTAHNPLAVWCKMSAGSIICLDMTVSSGLYT